MIKTLILDFAGVITTSALFPRVAEVFDKKKVVGKERFLQILKSNEKEYVLGNMTTKSFWEKVCAGTTISYDEFVKEISWYQLNMEVLVLLQKLRDKYQLVLLSDSYDALHKVIKKDKRLHGLFDYCFYSHLIHMVKMYDEEKVFNYVLEKLEKKPAECVFIDDKETNLIPAKKMGISVILFKSITQLKKELVDLGVDFD